MRLSSPRGIHHAALPISAIVAGMATVQGQEAETLDGLLRMAAEIERIASAVRARR